MDELQKLVTEFAAVIIRYLNYKNRSAFSRSTMSVEAAKEEFTRVGIEQLETLILNLPSSSRPEDRSLLLKYIFKEITFIQKIDVKQLLLEERIFKDTTDTTRPTLPLRMRILNLFLNCQHLIKPKHKGQPVTLSIGKETFLMTGAFDCQSGIFLNDCLMTYGINPNLEPADVVRKILELLTKINVPEKVKRYDLLQDTRKTEDDDNFQNLVEQIFPVSEERAKMAHAKAVATNLSHEEESKREMADLVASLELNDINQHEGDISKVDVTTQTDMICPPVPTSTLSTTSSIEHSTTVATSSTAENTSLIAATNTITTPTITTSSESSSLQGDSASTSTIIGSSTTSSVISNKAAASSHLSSTEAEELVSLRKSTLMQGYQLTSKQQALEIRNGEIKKLNSIIKDKDQKITELGNELTERNTEIARLKETIAKFNAQNQKPPLPSRPRTSVGEPPISGAPAPATGTPIPTTAPTSRTLTTGITTTGLHFFSCAARPSTTGDSSTSTLTL